MKTKVYITRHGETEWNTQGRFQGFANSDLTELGVKQAIWLEQRIRNLDIDIIYSSPTGRAYETTKILEKSRGIGIITHDGLREINVGCWEGKTQDEIRELSTDNHFNFWNKPSLYIPSEGAETYEAMADRSFATINEIIKNNQGKRILIVTHTIVIKTFMSKLEGRDIDTIWNPPFVKQTSLTEIDFDNDSYEIILNADMSHHEYSFKEFNQFK